jgi:uncharacterized protein (TIGR02996 family)
MSLLPHPAGPRREMLALLQNVKDHPEDDSPRLILGDWLEEAGDPRGEFFRLQSQHSPLPEEDEDYELPEPSDREQDLLAQHQADWLGPLQLRVKGPYSWDKEQDGWEFRRGLLRLTLYTDVQFLDQRVQSLAGTETWAWVEGLTLFYPAEEVQEVANSPLLATLAHLKVHGCHSEIGLDELEALLNSPHLGSLRTLKLPSHRFGDDAVALLAASKVLERITVLDLSANHIRSAGVARLLASPHLGRLTALDLSNQAIGDEGVAALAACPRLSEITYLGLFAVDVGDKGLQALAASPYLGQLREINLARNPIGDAGALALARSKKLKNLSRVTIYANDIVEAWGALSRRFKGGLCA